MRPLFQAPVLSPEAFLALKKDVVPANLHDVAGEVYDDRLYSLYTVSSAFQDNDCAVSIIAQGLVEHTAGNGERGYWVGIGINKELVDEASECYVGWGSWDEKRDASLIAEPDGLQAVGNDAYNTFYWNSGNAAKHEYKGYVVFVILLDNGTDEPSEVHIHYNVDFTRINMTESVSNEAIRWDGVSVAKLRTNYLFGIPLTDPNGNPLPDSLLIHYINAATDWFQMILDIVIEETEFEHEKHDYIRNDYQNWGWIQCLHKPVKEVRAVRLMYGNRPSIEIPHDWIQLNKLTGQITLFPQSGSANSLIIGQTGLLYGFQSQWAYAPYLWEVDYVAGIDENDPTMPIELLQEAINKRAAMGIMAVWGDLILGAGIASQSVSIDGISQSLSSTQSAIYSNLLIFATFI